jgi:hypothetical protein
MSVTPLRAALALGLLLTTACGFILTQAPPADHLSQPYFSCTESNAGPVIDVIWGGLNVLGGLLASDDPSSQFYSPDAGQTRVLGLAWGVLSGSAAATGFDKTKRCREAKRELAERQRAAAANASPQATTETVATVEVTPAADTLVVDGVRQLIASARGSSGLPARDRSYTWSSSNDAVASVDAAGLVTAHAPGTVVIAARTGFVVGTTKLVIRQP